MQHWLKVMHSFDPATSRAVGDPHRTNAGGEPVMRPAYAPGDRALIYLAGTYRCPAVVEVTAPPWFDAAQERWGWRTEVRVVAAVLDIGDAPPIEAAGIPRVALGRQSRLRLRPEQFAGAAALIPPWPGGGGGRR